MDLADIKKLISQTRVSIRQVLGLEKRLTDLESAGPGGTSDHAALTHLGYADSGHTGFMPTTTIPDELADLTEDATHRTVTDTEKGTWSGKQDALGFTAVPNTREINGLQLNADIDLDMDDLFDGLTYVRSENNYTDAEVTKLAGIEAGAEVNVNADWNAVAGDAVIANKPSIPSALTPADTVVSETSASQSPAVGTSLDYAREDHTHGTPAAGAGSFSATQVECDFGTPLAYAKEFTITDASCTTGSKIMCSMAYVATADNDADEIEMSGVMVAAGIPAAGSFIANIIANDGPINGKFKINYALSA